VFQAAPDGDCDTMSAIERQTQTENGPALHELPDFDLEYLFDDDDDPSEVTVFVDNAAALSTNWITVDADHAVALEEVR